MRNNTKEVSSFRTLVQKIRNCFKPLPNAYQIFRERLRWLNPLTPRNKGMRWCYFKLFFSSYFTPRQEPGESSWTEDETAYMNGSLFMDEEDLN